MQQQDFVGPIKPPAQKSVPQQLQEKKSSWSAGPMAASSQLQQRQKASRSRNTTQKTHKITVSRPQPQASPQGKKSGWTVGPMAAMNKPKTRPSPVPTAPQGWGAGPMQRARPRTNVPAPIPDMISELGPSSKNVQRPTLPQGFEVPPPSNSIYDFVDKKTLASKSTMSAIHQAKESPSKTVPADFMGPLPPGVTRQPKELSVDDKKLNSYVQNYTKGYEAGEFDTVREFVIKDFDDRHIIPSGGIVRGMLRGDDIEIDRLTHQIIAALNKKDTSKTTKTYDKDEGIQQRYFETKQTAEEYKKEYQDAIKNLDQQFPSVNADGEPLTYTYTDDDGVSHTGVSAANVADWVREKILEYTSKIAGLDEIIYGNADNLSLEQQGYIAQREWHPDTKVISYDPSTHHLDTDTGIVIPGAERSAGGDKMYYTAFPYEGAELYTTYKERLDKEALPMTTAIMLTGYNPLGLKSTTQELLGKHDEAEGTTIAGMHGIKSIGKTYNPLTNTWKDKSKIEEAVGFGKFWLQSPATQVGIAVVGGGLSGSVGSAAVGSLKHTLGTTIIPKVAQGAMIGAAGAMAIPSIRQTAYSLEKGETAEAVAQTGMLAAQIGAGYAGFKWGQHMRFQSPSGKLTKGEFVKGLFRQPKTERTGLTRLSRLKQRGGELKTLDAWSKRSGLTSTQWGAEKGYQKFIGKQMMNLEAGKPAITNRFNFKNKWMQKLSTPRKGITSIEQGQALLDARQAGIQLKGRGGWGSEAFQARHSYDDILPSDIDDLAAKIARSKKPDKFMKDYMTNFITKKKRKGELLGSVLSKEGKLTPSDIDFHGAAREYAKIRYAAKQAGYKVPTSLKKNLTNLGLDIQKAERVGVVRTRFGQEKLPSIQKGKARLQSPSEQWSTGLDISTEVPSMRYQGGKAKDIAPTIQQTQRLWKQSGKPASLKKPYQKLVKSLQYLEKDPYVLSPAETQYLYPKSTLGDKWFQTKTKVIEKTMPKSYFEKDLSQTMGIFKHQTPRPTTGSIPLSRSSGGGFFTMPFSNVYNRSMSSSMGPSPSLSSIYSRSHSAISRGLSSSGPSSSRSSSSIPSRSHTSRKGSEHTESSPSSSTSPSVSSSSSSSTSSTSSTSSSSTSSSPSSSTTGYSGYYGGAFPIWPLRGGSSQKMGGGGGGMFGPGSGYKEREFKVPNMWSSKGGQWASGTQTRQQSRQAKPKKKSTFFSLTGGI